LNAEPHVELWRRAIALLAERWSEIAADPAGAP
jgi:hypothetical protein